ncbi:MAG: PSD1 and planctomycete cytochrome C domain-containing protein [Acidobacteriota bacterium]|nr:PSD1 and planctomycete cytochrome C domain-containing protein [Acidobacteriota bacterium]
MRKRSRNICPWARIRDSARPPVACFVILSVLLSPLVIASAAQDSKVDFQRQIRPLLSDACFQCHGPDPKVRMAGLRLDLREDLFQARTSGAPVVPGDPDNSLIIQRISHEDANLRMPPAYSQKTLSDDQIDLVRRWISDGAVWQQHWAFTRPRRPDLPEVKDNSWPRQDLDHFVLSRLESQGLAPSPPAEKSRILRRVTFDLTGLPPTLDELNAFLSDPSPAAYDKAVDRLLASPRYGERMAAVWLDLARYADTDGYQDDEPRIMWRWRDWVVDSLNQNLSFDQFTIQQLAGDLLPDPNPEQKLATGFLRNNRVNGEGGSIADEFRVEYAVDRVNTVSTAWMGLTVGCARCHDHKYDPISQTEFYRLFAFFNKISEPGTYRRSAAPTIKVPPRVVQRQLDRIHRELQVLDRDTPAYTELETRHRRLWEQVPATMIMREDEARETFVLGRGQYDQPGAKVTPGVPEILPPLPPGGSADRLLLARWLVDPSHPLTARVAANRLWQTHFGSGLVPTPEDFGVQGEPPTHPLLLDWLASELIRLKWDVKAFQRMIVTSATYLESSKLTPALLEKDPANLLLARGPRLRLPAEMIRDQALAVSGLLVGSVGGPSVKPYQPAGIWDEIAGGSTGAYKKGYEQGTGARLYRRSLYSFWRRTIHPPGMEVFDAPSREVCTSRRERTNTPLQALTLMNDVTYVEAARALAQRLIREGGPTDEDRVEFGFRLVTSRRPEPAEIEVLRRGLERHRSAYENDPAAAAKLVKVGESALGPEMDPVELAAHTALANGLLNLDETINRE